MRNLEWFVCLVASICGTIAAQVPVDKNNGKPADAAALRFEGLGEFGRTITTSSPDAQAYFNQGLCFLYAFNHDEAIRSFTKASELDPECAMAWWGVSVANGPHINNPIVPPERAKAAWEALVAAERNVDKVAAVERDLIEALRSRYAEQQPSDRKPLDEAYAAAMRKVWEKHPRDADVGALFAESLMDLRPWDLWTPSGEPQPGTNEVVSTLEKVLGLNPRHPLGLHLYIHAVEASPSPERADLAAATLRELQPGLGHLVHMPSHIDVRRGRWREAALANQKAIAADKQYRDKVPGQGFYRVYMAHNHHMLTYAAMMRGQSKLAISAIHEMVASMPADWIQTNALLADGFTAMPLEVLVRFGRWEEVLASPEPPEYLPLARCFRHAARGVAYAATGKLSEAKAEQQTLEAAAAKLPEESVFGNNKGRDLVEVARQLLAGEILFREGKAAEGIEKLREAVALEDKLRYSEPPDWIHPVRHALGASLLEAGRVAEAVEVYQEDLRRQPENGWSLLGLSNCLRAQGKETEATQMIARFEQAWSEADVIISSSCYCLPGKDSPKAD